MSIRKRIWRAKGNDGQPVMREGWVVDYRDGAGKRHVKGGFDKKKDAEAYRDSVALEIRQGTHTPDSASITIAEAAQRWLDVCEKGDGEREPLERSSLKQYQGHASRYITPRLGAVKLSKLTGPGVRDFLSALRDAGASAAMARKVRASLTAIINHAQASGLVAQNVALAARQRKQSTRHKELVREGVHFPTKDEVRQLINTADGRFRPLLICAIFSGMRASELRGLPWDAVDFQGGVIHVRQRADEWGCLGRPKSAAGRRKIIMTPLLANTLKAWNLESPHSGLVFPNGTGKPESHANLWNRHFSPLQVACGISETVMIEDEHGDLVAKVHKDGSPVLRGRYGFHGLRHWFASWLISEGFNVKRVQEQLGHSSATMTLDVYGHLFKVEDSEVDALAQSAARLLA